MKLRLFFLCLLACGVALADMLPVSLLRASRQLQGMDTLAANFTQTRRMPALTKPFIVNGRLFYQRKAGLLWRIERPYQHVYLLEPERITEISAEGRRKIRDARDMPALKHINEIFQSLMRADLDALSRHFLIQSSGDDVRWRLVLKPRQDTVRQSLSEIVAEGGAHLEDLRILGANGESTQITFTRIRENATAELADTHLLSGASP